MSEINSFSDYASRYNTNMDFSTLFGGGAPYIDSGMGGVNVSDYVLSCKLDAPVPCRLDAPDFGFVCHVLADCLHQHQQVI